MKFVAIFRFPSSLVLGEKNYTVYRNSIGNSVIHMASSPQQLDHLILILHHNSKKQQWLQPIASKI